jgi:hypothetical protein
LELVVEIAVDKEDTATEVEELNVLKEVVNEVIADPLERERLVRLLAIEFSAFVARVVSVEMAVDNEVLFVLVDTERAFIVEVTELKEVILVEDSVDIAVLNDAKLYNSELSIIFINDCNEDRALVSNKEYVLSASSIYLLFATSLAFIGLANPVIVVPEVNCIICVLLSYALIVAAPFK